MKYFLTCIYLCVGFLISKEGFCNIADSLFSAGNYQNAAIEYERMAYKAADNEERSLALLAKAKAYFHLEEFQEAAGAVERVLFYGLNDEVRTQVLLFNAYYNYLAENFANAEYALVRLYSFIPDIENNFDYLYLRTLVSGQLWKLDEMKQYMVLMAKNQLTEDDAAIVIGEIEMLFQEKKVPKLKKLKKAQTLSSFMPGVGQMYAGYFWDGVVNSGLQVTFLGLTAFGIYSGYYITSVLVTFSVFQKLYVGADPRLEYLVEKKNHELVQGFNAKGRLILEKISDVSEERKSY